MCGGGTWLVGRSLAPGLPPKSHGLCASSVFWRAHLHIPCVPDRPSKILLVQVGTLSSSALRDSNKKPAPSRNPSDPPEPVAEEALSGGRSEFILPRSTLYCVEAPGPESAGGGEQPGARRPHHLRLSSSATSARRPAIVLVVGARVRCGTSWSTQYQPQPESAHVQGLFKEI